MADERFPRREFFKRLVEPLIKPKKDSAVPLQPQPIPPDIQRAKDRYERKKNRPEDRRYARSKRKRRKKIIKEIDKLLPPIPPEDF